MAWVAVVVQVHSLAWEHLHSVMQPKKKKKKKIGYQCHLEKDYKIVQAKPENTCWLAALWGGLYCAHLHSFFNVVITPLSGFEECLM